MARLLIILSIVFVLLNIRTFRQSIMLIANNVLSTYSANSQYSFSFFQVNTMGFNSFSSNTKLLIMIIGIVSMLCVRSICGRQGYLNAFVLTFPFMFAIILFTLQPNWIAFMMVLVFWLTLLFMQLASHHKTFSTLTSTSTIGIITMVTLSVLMFGIYGIVSPASYQRATWVELTRMQLQTKFREMLYGAISSDSGKLDLATARNRYYTGRVDLVVTSELSKSMFLRGFSASIYQDNQWSNPTSEAYYDRLDSTLKNMNPFTLVNDAIKMSSNTGLPRTYKFQVKNQYGNDNYVYTPYYIANAVDEGQYDIVMDAYLEGNEDRDSTYKFDIWNETSFDITQLLPNRYQISYQRSNEKYNIEVPRNLQTVFAKLQIPGMREATSDHEKIEAIIQYLDSVTEYTLMPGSTPDDVDFVEYFLETNKKGYCVHYATTATMLFRYYGIPARYVEGYRIGSADFVGNTAEVKDFTAHAWVEVADLHYGWIPVEVTPASSANGDGLSSPQVNPNPSPDPENPTPDDQTQNDPNTPEQEDQEPFDTPSEDSTKETGNDFNWYYIFLPMIGLLMVIAYGVMTRVRRKQSFHQTDHRKSVYAYAKYLASFHKEDAYPEQILVILEKARFSKHSISEQELDVLALYTKQYIETIKKRVSFWKKLWYRILARY